MNNNYEHSTIGNRGGNRRNNFVENLGTGNISDRSFNNNINRSIYNRSTPALLGRSSSSSSSSSNSSSSRNDGWQPIRMEEGGRGRRDAGGGKIQVSHIATMLSLNNRNGKNKNSGQGQG